MICQILALCTEELDNKISHFMNAPAIISLPDLESSGTVVAPRSCPSSPRKQPPSFLQSGQAPIPGLPQSGQAPPPGVEQLRVSDPGQPIGEPQAGHGSGSGSEDEGYNPSYTATLPTPELNAGSDSPVGLYNNCPQQRTSQAQSSLHVFPSDDIRYKKRDITINKDEGIIKKIIKQGMGTETPANGDKVFIYYVGSLTDESRDQGERFSFTLGRSEVIKGWDQGVATMKIGEKAMFTIKADYGYGSAGSPPNIPG